MEEKMIYGELNKFLPVDKIELYNDGIGYVQLYDSSHSNESEAQRIWTVTQICSLAYGNEEAKNPEALYERMKSIKHESLWEFIRHGSRLGSKISESMRGYLFDYPEDPYLLSLPIHMVSHKQNIACFRIKVPIFIARQFMRHRSFSYLEMSRRYTKDSKQPFEFWFPKDFHDNWKQEFINKNMDLYNNMAQCDGYHTQVASRFLPQTTYTEFYVMGEVDGLKNFFQLRLDSHAQEEIRLCAEAMLSLLQLHQTELYFKVL